MSINIKELMIAALLPALKEVGKLELKEVLSNIQAHNSLDIYTNTLKSMNSSFLMLKEVAVKSKTMIDDGIIDIVLEAVKESAQEDGIQL